MLVDGPLIAGRMTKNFIIDVTNYLETYLIELLVFTTSTKMMN